VIRHLTAAAMLLVFACSVSESDEGPREELLGDFSLGGLPITGYGGSMGVGGATSSSNSATVGTGVGGGCLDPVEPNDVEAQAFSLGAFNDCDEKGSMIQGVLGGPSDADWYRYVGADDFGCVVDPLRSVTASNSVRVCKFAECTDGSAPGISCQNGSTPDTSPDGRAGCCFTAGFGMDVDCDATSDDATVYIRIDNPGDACVVYDIAYHF